MVLSKQDYLNRKIYRLSSKYMKLLNLLDTKRGAVTDVSPLLELRHVSTTTKKFVEGFKEKTEFYDNLWKDRVVLYNEFLF